MPIVLAIVLAILALFGASPANAASLPASQPASQSASILSVFQSETAPESIACHEDMACWDCATMGNMQCGPVAHEADAYLAFDALGGVPTDESLMLTYVSSFTTDLPELTAGQFILHSTQTDGLNHVMQWTSVQSC
jgi:hypothetical protein